MRLRDQIRAAACISWVMVLGFGTYFACEARPSRAGVIREGSAGGTRLADPGAQDAQSRPGNRQGTQPESLAANAGSPGLAFYPRAQAQSRYTGVVLPPVGRTQGVRLVPAEKLTRSLLKEARRGHFQPYVLTGYSHGCILPKFGPEPPPQRMASGEWPVAGLHVAADPSMAFGTVLEVVYRGLPSRLIVGDRGRAIRGRRLDLFLRSCEEAKAWGRRTAYVREIGASE